MANRLEFSVYSDNLWDYLESDMPDLPSASNRQLVLEISRTDEEQSHRIAIWDYFFRPRPESVGRGSLRVELATLMEQVPMEESDASKRLQELRAEMAALESRWRDDSSRINSDLAQIEDRITKQELSAGRSRLAFGILISSIAFLVALLPFFFPMKAEDRFACSSIFLLIFGSPFLVFGVPLLISGHRRTVPECIKKVVDREQEQLFVHLNATKAQFESSWQGAKAQADFQEQILARRIPLLKGRINFLLDSLKYLTSQIPTPPTDEEVAFWLERDIDGLIGAGIEKLGLFGKLARLDGSTNPFILRSPGEIQRSEVIPRICYHEEREKYLSARRIGRQENGQLFQHFGIICLDILYITEVSLARCSLYFDFIRGEILSERSPRQHFADVVVLEMSKEHRQIEVDKILVNLWHAPVLRMSLKDSGEISITLPNDEYFKALGVKDFMSNKSDYNAAVAADSALKSIQLSVEQAKKKLEFSGSASQESESSFGSDL